MFQQIEFTEWHIRFVILGFSIFATIFVIATWKALRLDKGRIRDWSQRLIENDSETHSSETKPRQP